MTGFIWWGMRAPFRMTEARVDMKTSILLAIAWVLAGCATTTSPVGEPGAEPGNGMSGAAASNRDDAAAAVAAAASPGGDDGGSLPNDTATFDGGSGDGGSNPDVAPTANAAPPSVSTDGGGACTVTAAAAQCNSLPVVTIMDSADTRTVYWAMPAGNAPAGGWPAVVLYQGTGFGPSVTWNVSIGPSTPFGGYYQVALVAALLDAGFVVVQPPANGAYWDTNVGPYDTSADAAFIPKLLSELAGGTFGSVDMQKLYATGISSGGYMTSRMAVSYGGKFRALAIESGSYATCGGPACTIPATLPADHPPTLFLHGGMDVIVPISTAEAYYQELKAQGFDTSFVEDPSAGHQWLSVAPQDVVQWFTTH
jgi:predicted esterase